jgi:ribosomal protein S7
MSDVRKWYVDKALHSTRSLMEVINDLTMGEIEAALALESATRRRDRIMQRLVGRAARLNEQSFVKQLCERFNYAQGKERGAVRR